MTSGGTGCDEITEGDCRYLAKEVLRGAKTQSDVPCVVGANVASVRQGDLRDLTKADIFSLGLVLYELATNPQQLPSNGPEWQMLRERLEVQHLRQLSHPVQLLLQEMVKPQKEARPSCEALIQRVVHRRNDGEHNEHHNHNREHNDHERDHKDNAEVLTINVRRTDVLQRLIEM
eukprot:g30189.t1